MNWQAITAITEIIGTIFILVSLLYLAIQIKSNTKEVQTENIHRVTDSFNSLNLQIASDERLAQLWQKAFHDYENLSEIEMTQINLLWLSAFRIYDSLYHQVKSGTMDEDIWHGELETIKWLFSAPGHNSWWKQNNFSFSPSFINFIETSIIGKNGKYS